MNFVRALSLVFVHGAYIYYMYARVSIAVSANVRCICVLFQTYVRVHTAHF